MHIALLTDGITPFVTGGMQRHSHHLARHLVKLGVKITLVHCVYTDEKLPSESKVREALGIDDPDIIIHSLRFPKLPGIGHYLRESYRYSCTIYELLQPHLKKYDFIYAKGFTAWCILENKKKGEHMAPVGVKFHGFEMFQKNNNIKGRLEQFLLKPAVLFNCRNADVVFSYGGEIDNIIQKIGIQPDDMLSIPSGIDDEWIKPVIEPEGEIRKFIFVGRNERRKGLSDIVALGSTIQSLPIEFHFVGPIPDDKKMQAANCIYHGEVKDGNRLMNLLDESQVLVAPSHAEGMPNVILEGMARGLAIIATRVGAVPTMVSDENGAVISPECKTELKDALIRFATMPRAELHLLRQNSLDKVASEFRWSAIASRTLEEIEKVTFTKK